MDIRKIRDLTLVELGEDNTLIITCDSCGAVGEKKHDVLKVPPYYTGKFTARVALMEVMATGAKVVGIVNGVCCEMNPTGKALIEGILEELRAAGIEESVLTGSTEENFPVSTTALAMTAIGIGNRKKLKLNNLQAEALLMVVGIPKVGAEVEWELNTDIVQYSDLCKLIASPEVLEIVPVGSKGISYEAENLCVLNGGRLIKHDEIKLDINKSAGPSTVIIVGIKKEGLPLLKNLNAPVNFLGYFVK